MSQNDSVKAVHGVPADSKVEEPVRREAMRQRKAFVTNIVRHDEVAIGPDAAMHELAPTLRDKDLGGVPEADGDRLVRIVPGRNFFRMPGL